MMFKDILAKLKNDGLMMVTGLVMLGLLCFITYAAVYVDLKNKEVVLMLFGTISGYAGGILTFYFGSSKGSADKTKLMADKQSNA